MAENSGTGRMTERLYWRISKREKATIDRMKLAGGHDTDAALMRALCRAYCEELGIDWPDDNQPANGAERLIEARRKKSASKRRES